MSKQKKIPKLSQPQPAKRISVKSTQLFQAISTDDRYPSFRFTYTDKNRWQLSDWTTSEIDDLIQGLKKIEKYTWSQIKAHGSKRQGQSVGTGYKLIDNLPNLPENIPEDVKISEMRIDDKKRIFGFRVEAIYYIIWFDRQHSVCPE